MHKLDIYLDETDSFEATSGIHMMYYAGVNDDRTVWAADPFPERDPDARLEHVPVSFTEDVFPEFLDYHLRCQIRDCYIGIGLEPPEQYRVLGPGRNKFTLKYTHFEMYPRYHDYTADVPCYEAADYFNAGPFISKLKNFL